MSNRINVSPEELRTKANEFRSSGDDFESVINRMTGLIDDLTSSWEGNASVGFRDQYEQLVPAFNATKQLIIDISSQLDGTASAMEDLDNEIASRFVI